MERLGTGEADLRRAGDLLLRGKLVVFPTETLYGLAARAADRRAVEWVVKTKGRHTGSPLPLLEPMKAGASAPVTIFPGRSSAPISFPSRYTRRAWPSNVPAQWCQAPSRTGAGLSSASHSS